MVTNINNSKLLEVKTLNFNKFITKYLFRYLFLFLFDLDKCR